VVVLPDGEGYLINPSMPALVGSQTFQLWALSRGKVVSLGVLGSHPTGAPIRVEPTMTVLMINEEPLGARRRRRHRFWSRGTYPSVCDPADRARKW